MVREIVVVSNEEGKKILSTPCSKVTLKEASGVVKDLMDTVKSCNEKYQNGEIEKNCCGLAANQIGINKSVFVYKTAEDKWDHMINPIITNRSKETFENEEGCMSMDGHSVVTRHRAIEVFYQKLGSNRTYKTKFTGFTAVVIQHETDHLKGVLI